MQENSELLEITVEEPVKESIGKLLVSVKKISDSFQTQRQTNLLLNEKIKELEISNEDKVSRFWELNESMRLMQTKIIDFEEKINNLKNENQILKEEANKKSSEILELKEDIFKYEKQVNELNDSIEDKKKNLYDLEEENLKIGIKNEDLEEINFKYKELQKENTGLSDKISYFKDLEKNFDYAKKGLAEKNQEIFKKNQEIDSLKNNISELESKLLLTKDLEKSYLELKKDKESIELNLQEVIKEKNDANENFNKYKSDSLEDKRLIDTINNDLNKKLLQYQSVLDEFEIIKQEYEIIQNEKNSINEKLIAEEEIILLLKTENESIKSRTRQENESFKADNTELKKIISSQESALNQYSQQLLDLKFEQNEFQKKLSALSNEKNILIEESNVLKINYDHNEKDLNISKEINAKKDTQISDFVNDIKTLKANILVLENIRNKLNEQLSISEEKILILEKDNKVLNIDIEKYKQIELDNSYIKRKAEEYLTDIKSLKNQLILKETAINNLQLKLIDSEKVFQELKYIKEQFEREKLLFENKILSRNNENSDNLIVINEKNDEISRLKDIINENILELSKSSIEKNLNIDIHNKKSELIGRIEDVLFSLEK
jgi:chromosome segregation ATPase